MLIKKDRNETLNRKFINVKLNNKSIWMQLDTGSDISIILWLIKKTWKALGKPYLDLTRKVTCSVCDNKLIFSGQITVNGKLAKVKDYILKNDTLNLFGTNWIELLDL